MLVFIYLVLQSSQPLESSFYAKFIATLKLSDVLKFPLSCTWRAMISPLVLTVSLYIWSRQILTLGWLMEVPLNRRKHWLKAPRGSPTPSYSIPFGILFNLLSSTYLSMRWIARANGPIICSLLSSYEMHASLRSAKKDGSIVKSHRINFTVLLSGSVYCSPLPLFLRSTLSSNLSKTCIYYFL